MSLQGTTIDGATQVGTPVGTEVLPYGDGSGNPLSVSIDQILSLGLGGATVTANTLLRASGTTGKRYKKTGIVVSDTDGITLPEKITVGTNNLATTATCTHAAGAANSINVTITVKDGAGATIAACHRLEVFIAEDTNGALGLTTDTFSGALTASTGNILSVLTATKHVICTTDVNGVLVLNLVDTGKPADQYFCVAPPMLGGRLIVSAASSTHWG